MDSSGENLVNLTNDPADDWNPAWSPDGSQIAFTSIRDTGQGKLQYIFVMDADGQNVYQLTYLSESDFADWSPDGSMIAFSSAVSGNLEIYLTQADGSSEPIQITHNDVQDIKPKWSPDGSQIVFVSGDEGNRNAFVMDADGSNVLELINNGSVETADWTFDGRVRIFMTDRGGYGCTDCVMNADGSSIEDNVDLLNLIPLLPYFTLEGEHVLLFHVDTDTVAQISNGAVTTQDPVNEEIYKMSSDYPGLFINITNNPGNDRNPVYPADCLMIR